MHHIQINEVNLAKVMNNEVAHLNYFYGNEKL